MSRSCNICGYITKDVETYCHACVAHRCSLCYELGHIIRIPFLNKVQHEQLHYSKSLKLAESCDSYESRNTVFFVHCNSELDGCGNICPSTETHCDCGKRLLSKQYDFKSLHFGQPIYFLRKGLSGIWENGVIVKMADEEENTVTVRYTGPSTSQWHAARFDECHTRNEVKSVEEFDLFSKEARKGRTAATRSKLERKYEPYVRETESKKSSGSSRSKKTNQSSRCRTKSTSTDLSINPLSDSIYWDHNEDDSDSEILDDSEEKCVVASHTSPENKKRKRYSKSSIVDNQLDATDTFIKSELVMSDIEDRKCSEIPLELLSKYILARHQLKPAYSAVNGRPFPNVDANAQRGLFFTLYYWLYPTMELRQNESFRRPDISVNELQELLIQCPTTMNELKVMRCFEKLKDVIPPIDDSLKRSMEDAKNVAPEAKSLYFIPDDGETMGHQVIKVIKFFFDSRQLQPSYTRISQLSPAIMQEVIQAKNLGTFLEASLAQALQSSLTQMKVTIPMTYDQFLAVMMLAYSLIGGRKALENSKGVKGLVFQKGEQSGSGAMYGGANEDFINKEIVQRARMGLHSKFLDVGSGIGQICIQVAATVGCSCFGLEVIQERHDAALLLIDTFDRVLQQIGCDQRVSSRMHLKKADFIEENDMVSSATVTFFNNFGTWFDSSHPGKTVCYSAEYCSQICSALEGSQILCLSKLLPASKWLIHSQFQSESKAFTWTDNPVTIHHYVVPRVKQWACKLCTYLNDPDQPSCQCCDAKARNPRGKIGL